MEQDDRIMPGGGGVVGRRRGGGVYQTRANSTSTSLLHSNTISYNNCSSGAGLYIYSLILDSVGGRAMVQYCLVENNRAFDNGGGVYIYSRDNVVVPSNCVFRFNTATQGGDICFGNGPNAVEDCTIILNTATSFGGGVYGGSVYGSGVFFRRCVITGNVHADYPGVYIPGGSDFKGVGSANFDVCRITDNVGRRSVYLGGANYPVRFRNCTIAAGQPYGIDVAAIGTNAAAGPTNLCYPLFQNTIIYNHATNIYSTNAAVLANILTNAFTNCCSPQLAAPGFNNVTGNPRFSAPASAKSCGDFCAPAWRRA